MTTSESNLRTCTVCGLDFHPTRMADDESFVLAYPGKAAKAQEGSCADCAQGRPAGSRIA